MTVDFKNMSDASNHVVLQRKLLDKYIQKKPKLFLQYDHFGDEERIDPRTWELQSTTMNQPILQSLLVLLVVRNPPVVFVRESKSDPRQGASNSRARTATQEHGRSGPTEIPKVRFIRRANRHVAHLLGEWLLARQAHVPQQ